MPTLDQIIANLPVDPSRKGRAWEERCGWFLTHDPVYGGQLSRVWNWDARKAKSES